MAKQRDDRRDDELPPKKKHRPADEPADDLEIVEDAEVVEEVESADEPPAPPRRAGHTILGKASRQPTMLGKPEEDDEPAPKKPDPKKTQIASRDIFAETGDLPPVDPKKTQLGKQAKHTMLSQDDDVLDAEIAGDDEVLDAQPASGVIEADFADTPPGGGRPKQPASEVIRGEPLSSVSKIQPVSEVIKAEPLSDLSRVEPVEAEDVLSGDVKDRGPHALPESTVREESSLRPARLPAHSEDALEHDDLGNVIDSDVGLKSGKSKRRRDTSFPKPPEMDQTVAFDASGEHADLDDLLAEEEGGSAVDLGKKPKRGKSASGVDPVAEALESGVDIGDSHEGELIAKDSGEFGDLMTEEDDAVDLGSLESDTPKPIKKKAMLPGADEEDQTELMAESLSEDGDEELGDLFAEDDEPAPKKGKKAVVAADDDDAAAALLSGDDDDDSTSIATAADDEAGDLFDEDEAKPAKGKGKRAAVVADDEDEEELVGAGAGKKTRKMPPPPKPKYGRRWLGGMLLGILLLGGAAAGLWYMMPELVDPYIRMSPNYKQPLPEKVQAAYGKGDYDQVVTLLNGVESDKVPGAPAIRGEARWNKYFKNQTAEKKPLSLEDPEVKSAIEDLKKGNNVAFVEQIEKTVAEQTLRADVARLGAGDKAAQEVRAELANAKLIDAKADLPELPKAVAKTISDKSMAEALLTGISKVLSDAKQLEDPKAFDLPAFSKIVKDLTEAKGTLEKVDVLLDDAKLKGKGDVGVKELIAARNDVDTKLAAINKILEDEKTKDTNAKGVQEIIALRNALKTDRDELDVVLRDAYKELADAKIVPNEGDPRKELVPGTKLARRKAESPLAIPLTNVGQILGSIGNSAGGLLQQALDKSTLSSQLGFFQSREPLILSPERRLDTYLTLFKDWAYREAKDFDAATKTAEWILSNEAKYPAEAKGRAHLVQGLRYRNAEDFEKARESLKSAIKEAGGTKAEWVGQAEKSLAELTDANVYFLPRIERFHAEGSSEAALKEANLALKAIPNDPRILAERALVRVDLARTKGKVAPAAEKEIRDDAAAAQKDANAAPDAEFALGLLEENLDQLDKAESHYRAAIKSAKDDSSRYRIALGRLLQKERAPAAFVPPVEEKKQPEEKKEPQKDAKDDAKISHAPTMTHPLATMVAAVVLGQLPGEDEADPAIESRLKESIDIAKELIKSDNPKVRGQGHQLLGLALSKKGERTEGLKEYIKGLQLLNPGQSTADLHQLVLEHPAFNQPDSLKRPNPYLAELHFGRGLQHFWEKNYLAAEQDFKQSVTFYENDARYQYFLGMAMLKQAGKAKRDAAYYAFEKGAKLEASNRPAVSDINASLERIQGETRVFLDRFRLKGITTSIGE